MARVSNPFDVLESDEISSPTLTGEPQAAPSQAKKRRNKKKNKKLDDSLNEDSLKQEPEFESGSISADSLQKLTQNSPKTNGTSSTATVPLSANSKLSPSNANRDESRIQKDLSAAPVNSEKIPSSDSIASALEAKLEDEARAAASSDVKKLKLWHDWIAQSQIPQPVDASLSPLSWNQVFIRSKALELTLESCLHPPMNPIHWNHLQALLCSVIPSTETVQIFCQVAQDLSMGLSSFSSDSKLMNATKHAITSVLSALKYGNNLRIEKPMLSRLGDSSIQEKSHYYLSQMMEMERALQQMGTEPLSSTSLTERMRFSEELVKLSDERLKLLIPENPFALPNAFKDSISKNVSEFSQNLTSDTLNFDQQVSEIHENALKNIRTLANLISEKQSMELPVKTQTKPSHAVKQSQILSQSNSKSPFEIEERNLDLKKMILEMDEETISLSSQLIVAEEEVLRLKTAMDELEKKRQVVETQLQSSSLLSESTQPNIQSRPLISNESNHQNASNVVIESKEDDGDATDSVQMWKSQQLGIVHGLEALLLHPFPLVGQSSSNNFNESNEICSIVGKAVSDHLHALHNHLVNKQQMLQEVGQRMHFCETKMTPLKFEQKSLLSAGKHKLAMELSKPLDALEKMYKLRKNELQSIMSDAFSIESSLQHPLLRTAVALLPPLPQLHVLLQNIGGTLHQMRIDHKNILSGKTIKSNNESNHQPTKIDIPKIEILPVHHLHAQNLRQNMPPVKSIPINTISTNHVPKNPWRTIVPVADLASLGFQVSIFYPLPSLPSSSSSSFLFLSLPPLPRLLLLPPSSPPFPPSLSHFPLIHPIPFLCISFIILLFTPIFTPHHSSSLLISHISSISFIFLHSPFPHPFQPIDFISFFYSFVLKIFYFKIFIYFFP